MRQSIDTVAEALESRVLLAGATPVFWYKFDQGSGNAVTDIGENGANPKNHGTLVGDAPPQWVAGPSGNPGDFALNITNFRNTASGNPYFKHRVTGAVITDTSANGSVGPFAEGLIQLQNNVDPASPSPTTPDLSSVLNGNSSLAVWVKTTAVGDNNSWAAPSITGSEGRGLTNDIRWGYLDASGKIGVAAGDAGGVVSSTAINDGAWHLVVMSRSEDTNEISVWVDGALSARAVRSNSGAGGPLAVHFNVIGAATDSGNGNIATIEGYNVFNGALDDFRVYDHVLSAAEVQALLPAATTAPSVPTNPAVTLVNGQARLTWTDTANNELSYLIERTTADPANPANPDNSRWAQVGSAGAVSGTGLQGTFTDISSPYSGAKFFYRVRAFNSFNGGSFSAYATTPTSVAIPVAVPVERYEFNEGTGTTVADTGTPPGNTGTLSGANLPTFVPGPTGNQTALNFTGADSYVQTVNDLAPVVGNNATVSAWVKTTATGTSAILGTEIGSAPISLRWGTINGNGQVAVNVGTQAAIVSSRSVNDNQWHLVTMTRDTGSGEVKIYIDGFLDATGISDAGSKIATFNRIGAQTQVGENGQPNGTYAYFNGQLDDVRLYNSILSEADIINLLSTTPVTSGPAAPTGLMATANGGTMTLNWQDNANNEFKYIISRSESAGGPFTSVAEIPAIAGTGPATFSDTGLDIGKTYYYQVQAFNGFNGGTTSAPAGPANATFGLTAGPGVTGYLFNQAFWAGDPIRVLRPTVNETWDTTPNPAITNGGRASTVWTGRVRTAEAGTYTFVSSSDDDGYLYVNGVLVSADPGGHGMRNATLLSPINLAANTQYNLVFFQSNSGGGAAGARVQWVTPNMAAAGTTTPVVIPSTNLQTAIGTPATPTNLASETVGPHSVDLAFNSNNSGVVRYQLQRSSDTGQTWRTVSEVKPTTAVALGGPGEVLEPTVRIQDATALPGQTYLYRVVAMNFDSASAPSASVSVSTPSENPQDSGVQARYYNGEILTDRDPRNFAVSSPFPTEFFNNQFGIIDNDYTTNSPDTAAYGDHPRVANDSFSTVWTGKIRTNAAGVYTFITNSDDDAILFVNGVAVSQDLGAHGFRNATTLTPLTLAANTDYNFVLLHNDRNAGSGVRALWIEPGQTTAVAIPAGNPGVSGGLLTVMSVPHQQSVSATGVLSENPTASAAGTLTAGPPQAGTGVGLNWTDQSLSELWFEVQRTTPLAGNPSQPDNTKWAEVGRAGFNTGTFTDATAALGQTYFYRVRGVNFDAAGPFSNVVQGTSTAVAQDVINGTAGNDTMVLRRSANGQQIEWTLGAQSGQVPINSANGLTINGGGGSDTITLDTANGNPIPNLLKLNGSFVTSGPLSIGPNQTVAVGHSATPGGATLDVAGLTIDPLGKLDLNNNVLLVRTTPASVIRGYLASGFAAGEWTGNGIQSTDAGGTASLGWSSAAGVVTVKYTRNGDANLDGNVGFADLVALSQNYNTATGATWATGDFNYDGAVNFTDLVALSQNYNQGVASSPLAASGVSAESLAAMMGLSPTAPARPKPAPAKPARPAPVTASRPTFAVAKVATRGANDVLQASSKAKKVFR